MIIEQDQNEIILSTDELPDDLICPTVLSPDLLI